MKLLFAKMFLATAVGCLCIFPGQISKADETSAPLVTVIHIDTMPPFTQAAAALLDRFRQDSLQDPGEKQFQVLQQIDRPNHFTLVEAWLDQKSYDAHNSAAHTRHFRDEIQPMLGSPFDERIHTERK
jgi:quinol monooxygenase YgiN